MQMLAKPKFAVFDFDIANLRHKELHLKTDNVVRNKYQYVWMHVVSPTLHTMSLFWIHYIRGSVLNMEQSRFSSQLTQITQTTPSFDTFPLNFDFYNAIALKCSKM